MSQRSLTSSHHVISISEDINKIPRPASARYNFTYSAIGATRPYVWREVPLKSSAARIHHLCGICRLFEHLFWIHRDRYCHKTYSIIRLEQRRFKWFRTGLFGLCSVWDWEFRNSTRRCLPPLPAGWEQWESPCQYPSVWENAWPTWILDVK